ncbi:hypothetical protein VNO77_34166 [Canavalia gladiata]|uniref:Secreted protein n=1 Tax=Canavalia gladiata TaxID=3824 RepID=A0AAN9PZJ9_CANGL
MAWWLRNVWWLVVAWRLTWLGSALQRSEQRPKPLNLRLTWLGSALQRSEQRPKPLNLRLTWLGGLPGLPGLQGVSNPRPWALQPTWFLHDSCKACRQSLFAIEAKWHGCARLSKASLGSPYNKQQSGIHDA